MTKGRKHLLIGAGVVGVGIIGYILYRRHQEGSSTEGGGVPNYEYGTPGEAIAGGTGGSGGGGSSVEPIASTPAGGGTETPAAGSFGGAPTPTGNFTPPPGSFGGAPTGLGIFTGGPPPTSERTSFAPASGSGFSGAPTPGQGNQGRPPVQGRPPQVHLEPTEGHRGQGHEIVTTGEHGGHVVHPRQAQKRSVPVRKA